MSLTKVFQCNQQPNQQLNIPIISSCPLPSSQSQPLNNHFSDFYHHRLILSILELYIYMESHSMDSFVYIDFHQHNISEFNLCCIYQRFIFYC